MNVGTFRSLLRFRIDAADEMIKSHLENSSRNDRYTSASVQNEITNICKVSSRNSSWKKSIVHRCFYR